MQNNDYSEELEEIQGYIIKFKDNPLSVVKEILLNQYGIDLSDQNFIEIESFILEKIDIYREEIQLSHNIVKESILDLVDLDSEDIFYNEFYDVFNGISVKNIDENIIEYIENFDLVEEVYLDQKIQVNLAESVPLINADDVWRLHDRQGNDMTGKGVSVAILDTGIDYTHPDLVDNYVMGWDYVNDDLDPMDDCVTDHGTMVSGIVTGVAPDVELYVFKVMDENGSGWVSDAIDALDFVSINNIADIVSMSFGVSEGGFPDDPFSQAVDNAVNRGCIVVTSAGNNGTGVEKISSPACARKAIAVGATTKDDTIADFSSRGPVRWNDEVLIKPDIVAPGVGIVSTAIDGGYAYGSGTSMACPHVSGSIALLLQSHPEWTFEEVKQAIQESAIDIGYNETTQGAGRIDVLGAINMSAAPPFADLEISDKIPRAIVQINGTARSGTGNSDDFSNYSLYYRQNGNWIKINESSEEVDNGILCMWDTTDILDGYYNVKLIVRSQDQASIEIKNVLIGQLSDIILEYPAVVDEGEKFTLNILKNETTPLKCFCIFLSPFRLPKIRFSATPTFRAPKILNPLKDEVEGKLFVFNFRERTREIRKIRILNS